MTLSILIPAYNEELSIANTVINIHNTLKENEITHEILVVNDNIRDITEKILHGLEKNFLDSDM